MPDLSGIVRGTSRHLIAAFLGAVFAVAVSRLWGLDTRWFVVTVIGILGVSAAMVMIAYFAEFLLICLLFAIPFAGFGKWFFPSSLRETVFSSPSHNATLEGVAGVGVLDFIVLGLYLHWFFRIAILRSEKLPRLNNIDFWAFLFLSAYLVSLIGTAKVTLGLHATVYLLKFIALYFYISRHFRMRHVPWFMAALIFAVIVEGGFGTVQYTTGKLLGFGLDKGAGSALDYQYMVPGTEQWHRATGTLYDSHSLGLYLAMMIPFFLVGLFDNSIRPLFKTIMAGAMLLSLAVLLMTFTRSGWVACAASLVFAMFMLIFVWKDRRVIPFLAVGFLIFLVMAPWSIDLVIQRFQKSPVETLTTRFEGFWVALHIWSQHPLFGFGVGNYIEALWKYNYGWNQDIIVHNTVLWLGSETGLFGVVTFYGLIAAAALRAWKLAMGPRNLAATIGMAILIALCAFVVEGMATPMHREPAPFAFFWILISMSVALTRPVPETTHQYATVTEIGPRLQGSVGLPRD